MTSIQSAGKRSFDLVLSFFGLTVFFPIIILAFIAATIETRSSGLYIQSRLGKGAKPFRVYKIKTMYVSETQGTTVTVAGDSRITRSGKFMREFKVDELPQLYNVLVGDMSFVGPRPDVSGYLDQIDQEYSDVLLLRPGITGPATLKYRDEEVLLGGSDDPVKYNDEVIWPDKVKINLNYYRDWSFVSDLFYIKKTLIK